MYCEGSEETGSRFIWALYILRDVLLTGVVGGSARFLRVPEVEEKRNTMVS